MGETYDARLELILKKKGCETLYVVYVFENDKYYRLNESQVCSLMRKGIKIENAKFDIYGIGLLPDDSVSTAKLVEKYEESLAYWCEMNGDWGERLKAEYVDRRVGVSEISYGNQLKVKWKCSEEHEWGASVANRTNRKNSCPYCLSRRVSDKNSLYVWCMKHGEWGQKLLAEYSHKNLKSAHETSYGKRDKAIWVCSSGHEWEATIANRTSHKSGCPYCSGYYVSDRNSLYTWCIEHGEWGQRLLAEYSSENPKSVYEISYGSKDRVLWECLNGHLWIATVNSRTGCRRGCKRCSKSGTSYPEQFIYWAFKLGFPELSVSNRVKIQGLEADVYVEGFNNGGLILEYNGEAYHENKVEHDTVKLETFKKRGYCVLVIEEAKDAVSISCQKVDDNTIRFSMLYNQKEACLQNLIEYLFNILNRLDRISKLDFEKINSLALKHATGSIEFEKSLANLYPDLVKQEWDYEKNIVCPENITSGSNKKAFWICSKCGETYETKINYKVYGIACKNCGWSFVKNRYVKKFETCVVDYFPMLIEEFDEVKNAGIDLNKLCKYSSEEIVWTCKNCGQIWSTSLINRTSKQTACPKCRYSIFINDFKLAKPGSKPKIKEAYIELLDEFDENLNTEINKVQFGELTVGSGLRINFSCPKCGNTWRTAVATRINLKSGCPACGWNIFEQRYKGDKRKTIQEEFPQTLKEFDEKLNDISVECFLSLSAGASKRIWWRCANCRRVWENTVNGRTSHLSGCKKCGFNIFKAEKTHLGPLFNSDLQKEVLVIPDDTGESIDLEESWTEEEIQQDLESNHDNNEKDFTDIIELYKRRYKKGGTY